MQFLLIFIDLKNNFFNFLGLLKKKKKNLLFNNYFILFFILIFVFIFFFFLEYFKFYNLIIEFYNFSYLFFFKNLFKNFNYFLVEYNLKYNLFKESLLNFIFTITDFNFMKKVFKELSYMIKKNNYNFLYFFYKIKLYLYDLIFKNFIIIFQETQFYNKFKLNFTYMDFNPMDIKIKNPKKKTLFYKYTFLLEKIQIFKIRKLIYDDFFLHTCCKNIYNKNYKTKYKNNVFNIEIFWNILSNENIADGIFLKRQAKFFLKNFYFIYDKKINKEFLNFEHNYFLENNYIRSFFLFYCNPIIKKLQYSFYLPHEKLYKDSGRIENLFVDFSFNLLNPLINEPFPITFYESNLYLWKQKGVIMGSKRLLHYFIYGLFDRSIYKIGTTSYYVIDQKQADKLYNSILGYYRYIHFAFLYFPDFFKNFNYFKFYYKYNILEFFKNFLKNFFNIYIFYNIFIFLYVIYISIKGMHLLLKYNHSLGYIYFKRHLLLVLFISFFFKYNFISFDPSFCELYFLLLIPSILNFYLYDLFFWWEWNPIQKKKINFYYNYIYCFYSPFLILCFSLFIPLFFKEFFIHKIFLFFFFLAAFRRNDLRWKILFRFNFFYYFYLFYLIIIYDFFFFFTELKLKNSNYLLTFSKIKLIKIKNNYKNTIFHLNFDIISTKMLNQKIILNNISFFLFLKKYIQLLIYNYYLYFFFLSFIFFFFKIFFNIFIILNFYFINDIIILKKNLNYNFFIYNFLMNNFIESFYINYLKMQELNLNYYNILGQKNYVNFFIHRKDYVKYIYPYLYYYKMNKNYDKCLMFYVYKNNNKFNEFFFKFMILNNIFKKQSLYFYKYDLFSKSYFVYLLNNKYFFFNKNDYRLKYRFEIFNNLKLNNNIYNYITNKDLLFLNLFVKEFYKNTSMYVTPTAINLSKNFSLFFFKNNIYNLEYLKKIKGIEYRYSFFDSFKYYNKNFFQTYFYLYTILNQIYVKNKIIKFLCIQYNINKEFSIKNDNFFYDFIPHRKDYILYHKKFNEGLYLSFSKEIEIYLKNTKLNILNLKQEKFKINKIEKDKGIYKYQPNMRELYYTDFEKFKQYFVQDLYMDEDLDDIEEKLELEKKKKANQNIIKKKIIYN